MPAKRIIPCLSKRRPHRKGRNFVNLCDAGDPVEPGAKYLLHGSRRVGFFDITATTAPETLADLACDTPSPATSQYPLTIGGGIKAIDDKQMFYRMVLIKH
jgi:cyclase